MSIFDDKKLVSGAKSRQLYVLETLTTLHMHVLLYVVQTLYYATLIKGTSSCQKSQWLKTINP